MDSLTPVKILTGVHMGVFQIAGCFPQVNNITGALHGHHFHTTVMGLQTPEYGSTPKASHSPQPGLRNGQSTH
jgi:hypothetical protein